MTKGSVRPALRQYALRLAPPILIDAYRFLRRRLRIAHNTSDPSATVGEVKPVCDQIKFERKYWGLHDLDRQIEKYFNFDDGYFVELGANDGMLASNTLYFERTRGWRGVLVEPAPNLYLECVRNRAAQDHIVCAACVSFDYKPEFVKIIYSNSMSVSLDVETDIGDAAAHAELGRQFLKPGETVFTFGALARTLHSILGEANAPHRIDLLSLDVEGAEVEVLKGIDHDSYRFRYMLIECRELVRLEAYLTPLGYRMVEKFNEHDYMFADERGEL